MTTTTERTETRTIREWLEHQAGSQPTDRSIGFLQIRRYPEHDVALVHDGMTTWAARPADLDAALDSEATYRLEADEWGGDRVGSTPVATQAYTDLCQDIPALARDASGVAEACETFGMDPAALQV